MTDTTPHTATGRPSSPTNAQQRPDAVLRLVDEETAALRAECETMHHFVEEKGWCIPGGMPVTRCGSTVCDCGWSIVMDRASTAEAKVRTLAEDFVTQFERAEAAEADAERWRVRAQDQLDKRIDSLDLLERAVAAEAQVMVLTQRLARVEALPDDWESEADANETHPKECRTLLAVAAELRAALADPAEVTP